MDCHDHLGPWQHHNRAHLLPDTPRRRPKQKKRMDHINSQNHHPNRHHRTRPILHIPRYLRNQDHHLQKTLQHHREHHLRLHPPANQLRSAVFSLRNDFGSVLDCGNTSTRCSDTLPGIHGHCGPHRPCRSDGGPPDNISACEKRREGSTAHRHSNRRTDRRHNQYFRPNSVKSSPLPRVTQSPTHYDDFVH